MEVLSAPLQAQARQLPVFPINERNFLFCLSGPPPPFLPTSPGSYLPRAHLPPPIHAALILCPLQQDEMMHPISWSNSFICTASKRRQEKGGLAKHQPAGSAAPSIFPSSWEPLSQFLSYLPPAFPPALGSGPRSTSQTRPLSCWESWRRLSVDENLRTNTDSS